MKATELSFTIKVITLFEFSIGIFFNSSRHNENPTAIALDSYQVSVLILPDQQNSNATCLNFQVTGGEEHLYFRKKIN